MCWLVVNENVLFCCESHGKLAAVAFRKFYGIYIEIIANVARGDSPLTLTGIGL